MKDKRLVDATIQDLLDAIREEIKDASSDLISKSDAAALVGVTPAMITYYIKKGDLKEINGNISRHQVLKLYNQTDKTAA